MDVKSKVILYGQPNCSSCNHIKSFLKAREIDYTYVDVHTMDGSIAYLADFPNGKSVPRAVIVGSVLSDLKISGAENILRYFTKIGANE